MPLGDAYAFAAESLLASTSAVAQGAATANFAPFIVQL